MWAPRQGRACLVEMHRFNFLRQLELSLKTLQTGLALSLERYPAVRFVTPVELARAVARKAPTLLETRLGVRLKAWLARLPEVPRFTKVTRITGLVVPMRVLEWIL